MHQIEIRQYDGLVIVFNNKFKSSSDESVWAGMPSGVKTVCVAKKSKMLHSVISPLLRELEGKITLGRGLLEKIATKKLKDVQGLAKLEKKVSRNIVHQAFLFCKIRDPRWGRRSSSWKSLKLPINSASLRRSTSLAATCPTRSIIVMVSQWWHLPWPSGRL